MYRTKKYKKCEMPAEGAELNVLILNASLKHAPEKSNTEELAEQVVEYMKAHNCAIKAEAVRLADKIIPVGLGYKESDDDNWPEITEKIKKADIILFATPIWWGGHSSLMQRVLERLDSLDEEYLKTGRSALYNKVAGIVITGHEDGALKTMGNLMAALAWFGFTLPPECAAYWVGEVGEAGRGSDATKRNKNESTKTMALTCARNLVFYSQLLKKTPLEPEG